MHPLPFSRFTLRSAVRITALLAAAWTSAAQADVYGDVAQQLRDGKRAQALAAAQAYIAAKPTDPQMRFLLGVIQTESGSSEQAIQTFTRLTQEYPELPEPHNNLAVLLAGLGQFDRAREELEMAIRTNPDYATAHENLGDVYAKLASLAYARSLQIDKSNTVLAPKLGLLQQLLTPAPKPAKTP
jgi:Flp pilus assembly protein TadD